MVTLNFCQVSNSLKVKYLIFNKDRRKGMLEINILEEGIGLEKVVESEGRIFGSFDFLEGFRLNIK